MAVAVSDSVILLTVEPVVPDRVSDSLILLTVEPVVPDRVSDSLIAPDEVLPSDEDEDVMAASALPDIGKYRRGRRTVDTEAGELEKVHVHQNTVITSTYEYRLFILLMYTS